MIRVFIVDDHPVVIEGIHSLLKNEKDIAWVGQAMNAQSCIGFFVNNTADVVLMDISMPGMDGIDLCRRLRERKRTQPVILFSAMVQPTDRHYVLDAGANEFLIKPKDLDIFVPTVERLLGIERVGGGTMID